jgi:RNA recognition motif-containing protein
MNQAKLQESPGKGGASQSGSINAGVWDIPPGPIMGNSLGGFKPGGGNRPTQMPMEANSGRDLDGRRPMGGPNFSGDMIRAPMSGNLSMGGGDSMQNSYMRNEGYPGGRDSGMPLRGRESWPPGRQPGDMGRFSRNERVGFGGFGEAEDYDGHGEVEPRGFRGNYRGMGDFRRGGFPPREGRMGSLAGGSLLDRMGPGGLMQNEADERRGGNAFQPGDRRNQYRMDRGEQDFARNDRYVDQFGRDQLNDRYPGRPNTFSGDRFQRDRYPVGDRNFEPRPETRQVSGTSIELRNMPIETGYGEIRRFFQGLHITGNGLKLINDNHGNRVGIAYVRFQKREDKDEALKYTGKMIRGSMVEVLHLNDEIFDKAIDSYKPPQETESSAENPEKKETEDSFVCLCVKDLPPYAKEQDIIKLFQDIPIEEVIMLVTKDDRKQYMAFVKFTKPEDAKKALCCNSKHTIGHKAVTVAPCSEEELQEAKESQNRMAEEESNVKEKPSPDAKEKNQDSKSPQDTRSHGGTVEQPIQEPQKTPHPPTDCVLLKGLPVDANDRDILDFFSDVGLVPLRIHIMLDKFNKPTGDAFCEFSNVEEAARSCTKNNMPLGKQDVIVQAVLREEMNEALGLVSQPELPVHPVPLTRIQHPRDFGNRSMGLLGVSPSGPLLGRMPLLGRHPGSMPPGPFQSQISPIEGFGKPGCVVALENIPFRADIDEILEFFADFDVSRESVIRRFNDKGMATGDARVAFINPSEAQRAVRELRFHKIRGRPIYLSLL